MTRSPAHDALHLTRRILAGEVDLDEGCCLLAHHLMRLPALRHLDAAMTIAAFESRPDSLPRVHLVDACRALEPSLAALAASEDSPLPDVYPLGPSKDAERELAVAPIWRPVLRQIVQAFALGDHALERARLADVTVGPGVPDRVGDVIAGYGETLIPLPAATWTTSLALWMQSHWDVMVDLWTDESGRSDLVLHVRVLEAEHGYRYVVDSVHLRGHRSDRDTHARG